MNSKFYVSYEAARLLKEKGYDSDTEYAYHEIGDFSHWGRNVNDIDYLYAAPTKAEAIDWLESKGIVIEVQYRKLTGKYFSEIHYNKMRYKDRSSDLTEDYKVRLEAEEAAIIKACKLL